MFLEFRERSSILIFLALIILSFSSCYEMETPLPEISLEATPTPQEASPEPTLVPTAASIPTCPTVETPGYSWNCCCGQICLCTFEFCPRCLSSRPEEICSKGSFESRDHQISLKLRDQPGYLLFREITSGVLAGLRDFCNPETKGRLEIKLLKVCEEDFESKKQLQKLFNPTAFQENRGSPWWQLEVIGSRPDQEGSGKPTEERFGNLENFQKGESHIRNKREKQKFKEALKHQRLVPQGFLFKLRNGQTFQMRNLQIPNPKGGFSNVFRVPREI